MSRSPGRGGHAWRKACAIVLAPHILICIRCGRLIDKSLRFPHPWSKSVDHRVDLVDGGHPLDYRNLGPAHLHCNASAGRRGQIQRERARRSRPAMDGRAVYSQDP